MLLQERYCGDELQQAPAILAAMRGLMRLLITRQVTEGLDRAIDGTLEKAEPLREIKNVLLPILRGN
jgi:DNA-binding FrmR family transcriptional regulator